MEDYGYIVQDLGEMIGTNIDEYGYYGEIEATLTPEYTSRAYDQLEDRLNGAQDTYIDVYLRRYEDSTRIFIAVNEDFVENGEFIEEELELDDNERYDLDQISIGDYDF